jgi:uncharacterized protein YecE (DUF72 family)
MSSTTAHPILLGTSGWSYPDWVGPFYPDGLDSSDQLAFYADRFDVVEVDSSFYRPPTARMVRAWRSRTPDGFRFALKVPQVITHTKRLKDCAEEVEGFVGSILPLGEKLDCALLQLGYFNRQAFATFDEFLDTLDPFLAAWPHEKVPLAVEIRNPRWVHADLMTVLRAHGASYTLTDQSWMPRPWEVVEKLDVVTGPLVFVRLLGDREGIEKITTTWDRVVVDRSQDVDRLAAVLKELSARARVLVFANNHYAGHSPATVRMLRERLGLAEPEPPPRPRTTLFD